jgi:hypothetical protein
MKVTHTRAQAQKEKERERAAAANYIERNIIIRGSRDRKV